MSSLQTIIRLKVQDSASGSDVYEQVLVATKDDQTYEVLASPGLLSGVAAGDTIRVRGAGEFDVVARAGNVCVQVFSRSEIDEIDAFTTMQVVSVGGWLDGRVSRELVYTIPVSVGFPTIERILRDVVARFPTSEWLYGNVYDVDDGVTPLNWWLAAGPP